MRFLHLSDIHLGYQQYGLPERFNDFSRGFESAIAYGVSNHVDAILIAGDLFNKTTIEPMAFIQAAETLASARDAGISVLAIAGNHDQARYRDQISWLNVLAHEGYLHLLHPELSNDVCRLQPWDDGECEGGYIDIQNVRIVGLPWLGASTSSWLPEVASSIDTLPRDNTNFTVLLTHAALEGELARVASYVTHAQLVPLRHSVDYMALGHLHKPFEHDDWLYNPGSLEVYDISEISWGKGWYDVSVDQQGNKRVHRIHSTHRPFFSQEFPVGVYSNPADLLRSLRDSVREWASTWQAEGEKPVVEINLEGELTFERHDFDIQQVHQILREEAELLHTLVNTNKLRSPGMEINPDEILPQDELEKSVLCEIARSDSRFAAHPGDWARVMLEIKQMALEERDAGEILEALQLQIDQVERQVDHG